MAHPEVELMIGDFLRSVSDFLFVILFYALHLAYHNTF